MCRFTADARLTVSPTLTSVRTSREFVRQSSCPEHGELVLEQAVLLVSELVTNAVRHGVPPIEVAIECDESAVLCVRVRDAGAQLPTKVDLSNDGEGGRGLAIVDVLSDAWGVDGDERGKTVWFRLEADPTPAAASRRQTSGQG